MSYKGPRCAMAAGSLTLTANVFIGKRTPATPDGRRSGEPMADAISPRQGALNGPVSYVKSAAKLSHRKFSNGKPAEYPLRSALRRGGRGYVETGELIKRISNWAACSSSSTSWLRRSSERRRRTRCIKILSFASRFSTYFVHMSPEVQEDFINRSEQYV